MLILIVKKYISSIHSIYEKLKNKVKQEYLKRHLHTNSLELYP